MQPKKQHKRKFAPAVGAIFIVLAVIGAVTLAFFSVRLTWQLLDNQRQKSTFEDFLTPVVMFDPVPFEDPSDIEIQRLLLYSMWTVLSDDKSLDYSRDEVNGTLLVPASDLEAAAYKLFRDKVVLAHQSFSDNETTYFYDAERNTYQVPTYGFLYTPRPEVVEIEKTDDMYQLLVSYTPPDNAWSSIYKGGGTMFPNKIMLFTLGQDDSGWYLAEISYPPQDMWDQIPGASENLADQDQADYTDYQSIKDIEDVPAETPDDEEPIDPDEFYVPEKDASGEDLQDHLTIHNDGDDAPEESEETETETK